MRSDYLTLLIEFPGSVASFGGQETSGVTPDERQYMVDFH